MGEPDCDAVKVPKCSPGYVPEQTNVGECIPTYECVCNMTRNPCPEAPKCNEDLEELVSTETACCPDLTCGKTFNHFCLGLFVLFSSVLRCIAFD